uniref:Gluzincin n=1 Tax=Rhipicephalus zambeziensis TaxID=60191 RepID=A0A224Y3L9_9ACAR
MLSPTIIGMLWTLVCAALGDETTPVNSTICDDVECKKLVSQVTKQMGSSRPCDDFYNYTCGKWEGDRELKHRDIKIKAIRDLIALLDNATISLQGYSNASEKLINAYNSCVTTGGDEVGLRGAVQSALSTYGLKEWPIQENSNSENKGYKEILKETGPRPLFRYFASEENSTAIIYMTKPEEFFVYGMTVEGISAGSLSFRSDDSETTTEEYRDYSEYEQEEEAAYKDFINKTIRLVNNTFPESGISKVIDDIVQFEKELHKFASQASENTTQVSISEFIETIGDSVPMVEILNKDLKVINYTVNNTTEVKVQFAEYYQNVVKYLKNFTEQSAMQNYIGWVIIRDMAKAERTTLHGYYLEYRNRTLVTGLSEEKRDNKTLCVRQLLERDLMYTAAASFYIQNKFDNASKAEVMKIMEYMNVTFQYIIKNNTWMSQEIKNKTLERLNEMSLVIGYPEWLSENATVNELYKFVPYIEAGKSFIEHFFHLKENYHYQQLLKLTAKYFNKAHEEVVLKSHGFYDEDKDVVGYPAAALVTHYRKPPIPRATNFGTIGTAIAHILTHAIDRYDNKRINGSIVEKEFWDNATRTSFCNNSKCLNNSEQCRDAGADCTSQSHQKLHDYLGVRASHMALVLSKDNYTEPFVLNDTMLNTEDKIFFTFFGSLYCPYSVNENMLGKVESIQKVQERADIEDISFPKSLNEIVSIYDKFNTTFNCSGTLNDTCRLVPEEYQLPSVGCS